MRLGVLPEQGGSIANLRRTGQHTRFLRQYVRRYIQAFDEVHFFSYANERLDQEVGPTFHLHPNPGIHRWLYGFLMPVVQGRAMRRCSVLRVLQATGAIPAWLAKRLYGPPFVVTFGYHYSTELRAARRRFRAWLFDRRLAWALRRADGIIVTTPALADYARAIAPEERIALIPNSIDTDLFAPADERPAASPHRRLIAVGNLTENKDHSLLLEAVARTGRRDLTLTIFGRGPTEDALQRLAAEKGLALELPGIVPNETLPDRLREADAYCITSRSEGHPKSLLEAMSVGLPCIGTDAPGIRDVIRDGETGWLTPPAPAALARAIHRVYETPDAAAALGRKARAFVLEHYSAEVIMAREIAFLQEVARRAGRE